MPEDSQRPPQCRQIQFCVFVFHFSFSESLKSKLKGKISIFSIFLGLANDIEVGVLRTNYIGAISSGLKGVMKYDGEITVQAEDLGSGSDFATYICVCRRT